MLKNYFKIAYRTLLRNKMSTFINISGFSIAMACAMVIFLLIESQVGMDRFHQNAGQIFMATPQISQDGAHRLVGYAPIPLGPALKRDFKQVENAARISRKSGILSYGDRVFEEPICFADASFFEMFTFRITKGSPTPFKRPDAVILAESVARKYFGKSEAIGREIRLRFDKNPPESFTVTAVAEDPPSKTSFGFKVIVPFANMVKLGFAREDDWASHTDATFIQLTNRELIRTLEQQVGPYLELYNHANPTAPTAQLTFEPLLTLSQNAYRIERCIANGQDPVKHFLLSFVALLLLALPCFNFINIAIATAARRLKEIGFRKAVGSKKRQIISQFLLENLLLCFLALITALGLCELFLLPGFNALLGSTLKIDYLGSALWIFLPGLLLLVAWVAGAYPALYIASFQPANILRGTQAIKGSGKLSQSFQVAQYILAIISIIFAIGFVENDSYQRQLDWGYNPKDTIVIGVEHEQQADILAQSLSENPAVQMFAGAIRHIGAPGTEKVDVQIGASSYRALHFAVSPGYVQTMQLRIKDGKSFQGAGQHSHPALVNQTFIRNLGWQNPIGRHFSLGETTYHIVGVLDDFHYTHFGKPIGPVMFSPIKLTEARYFVIRGMPGRSDDLRDSLQQTWKLAFPDHPFNAISQDGVFDRHYHAMKNASTLFSYLAVFVLVISCMGLFGLVALNISRRLKEIGIRKILGASQARILSLVNHEFLRLFLIAAVIGIPLSYLVLQLFLKGGFAYSMSIGPKPFILAFAVILLSTALTISINVYRAVVANPVETLRHE